MPTYEYQCAACKHKFEEFQSIKAKPTRKCPKCGKMKVDRLLSAGAGMIFKGSGFYITDYRSENYKSDAKADSSASKVDSSASGGSAATAPAAESAKPTGSGEAKSTPAATPTPAPTSAKSESKPDSKRGGPKKN